MVKPKKSWSNVYYALNVALLATHQADAVFWKEWELFRVPGGAPFFLISTFLVLVAFLFGYEKVIQKTLVGRRFTAALMVTGFGLFFTHSYLLSKAAEPFRDFTSISILLAILLTSTAQLTEFWPKKAR